MKFTILAINDTVASRLKAEVDILKYQLKADVIDIVTELNDPMLNTKSRKSILGTIFLHTDGLVPRRTKKTLNKS